MEETIETVVTEATEAAVTLMNELAPMYDLAVVEMNISIVTLCALGIIAGILVGAALWRWLR